MARRSHWHRQCGEQSGQGEYQGIARMCLRWVDVQGNWFPIPEENVAGLAQQLREMGINPDEV
jgi:hypothetical protein